MAKKKSSTAVLQALEEYGDSLLEDQPKCKTGSKITSVPGNTHNAESSSETPERKKRKLNKKQRKKLRKRQQNQDGGESEKTAPKPLSKKLKWLKETLGKDSADILLQRDTDREQKKEKDKIPKRKEPEIFVFEDPAKKKRKKGQAEETSPSDEHVDFNMQTARFEVRKLGISGFGGEKKSDARVSLLINLGAKPPRQKSYINYKEFQVKRKAEMAARKQSNEEEKAPGEKLISEKINKSKSKSIKRSRSRKEAASMDGQIGHYKRGVQFINKDALKKLKT